MMLSILNIDPERRWQTVEETNLMEQVMVDIKVEVEVEGEK